MGAPIASVNWPAEIGVAVGIAVALVAIVVAPIGVWLVAFILRSRRKRPA